MAEKKNFLCHLEENLEEKITEQVREDVKC